VSVATTVRAPWLLALVVSALLAIAPRPALAVDMTPPLPDPVQQQRYTALIHELRCMQCQNEALADSNVSLAADLRAQVRDLIAAGKTDDEVRDYLVARYGEFILFRPRVNLRTLWLWAAPGVLLLAGLLTAVRVLRRRAALLTDDGEDAAGDTGTAPTRVDGAAAETAHVVPPSSPLPPPGTA
jgi:cytochrome c-type biogenesis protein CcmH